MSEPDAPGKHDLARLSQQIIDLIFRREFEHAARLIETARQKLSAGEAHRLTALSAVLRKQSGDLHGSIQLMRQANQEAPGWLPNLYRLSVFLMDAQLWSEADVVLDELISLSELNGDAYFIDEARFRKILCLKRLGRVDEIELEKGKIATGTEVFIEERLYRLDDLD